MELADLNAVRMALYQHTRDPDIGALPVAAQLDDSGRRLLIDKAVEWLLAHSGPTAMEEPPVADLRRLMEMATGAAMGDPEFEARRELLAFRPFPYTADWSGSKPAIPAGFRVAVIGSGFSGIAMGVQLEQLGIPYVVLERRSEAGGTWTINRYPDVRVDTISITYEFSFEKQYRWSEYFGQGDEVRAYLDHVARKYGVHDQTRFGHEVTAAEFDEGRDVWVLTVETPHGIELIEANAVVTAVGLFTNPLIPDWEGVESFGGTVVHPSRWPADLELEGRRVAIIGNGSTGVQMLGKIAEVARQVHVFQRTPQWISPRDKYGQPMEPEITWLLDHFPGYWHWWRYMATASLFATHNFLIPDEEWMSEGGHFNPANDKLRSDLTAYIESETSGRADLIQRLVPGYAPFSRRPVVDNGWYRALTRDNVELVTDPIGVFTPTGIQTTDGAVREVDVVITATGFEVARYLWPTRYTGRNGMSLEDVWSPDGARAYIGMMVPGFPNLFSLYGPNSQPLSGGTSLPAWYVLWSSWVGQCLVRLLETGGRRVEVSQAAYDRYNRELDDEAAKLLLMKKEGAPDRNYYLNEHGRMQVKAPWYGPDYHRMCSVVDWHEVEVS